MTPTICEREHDTTAAALSGTVNAEITSHASECTVCADILLVSDLLCEDQVLAASERTSLPDASLIWHKAKQRATQRALRAALRPIRFMKIIAVAVFFVSPWLRLLLPIGRELFSSWTRNLDFNVPLTPKILPTTTTQLVILLGFTAATILLSLSSWYMVRQE